MTAGKAAKVNAGRKKREERAQHEGVAEHHRDLSPAQRSGHSQKAGRGSNSALIHNSMNREKFPDCCILQY